MSKSLRPDRKWIDNFMKSLQPAALRGDYVTALSLAKAGLKAYPDEYICQYQYAKLLGDYADELPPAKKKKLKQEAIRILRPMLRRMRAIPEKARWGICLNYYYQSEDFVGMYRFGRRGPASDRQKSWYAQALAAGLIGHELHTAGKTARAKSWAKKSIAAWSKYNLAKEKYYFAHYMLAKAFAVAGDGPRAMKALKRAAVLAKRPVSDWEFADVVSIVDSARQ